jgi:hypothetical protein
MLSSPQVHRVNGFSYVMYFNEGLEPPHVHVSKAEAKAKFWLSPVELCSARGFNPTQLKQIKRRLIDLNAYFLEEWRATQTQNL